MFEENKVCLQRFVVLIVLRLPDSILLIFLLTELKIYRVEWNSAVLFDLNPLFVDV